MSVEIRENKSVLDVTFVQYLTEILREKLQDIVVDIQEFDKKKYHIYFSVEIYEKRSMLLRFLTGDWRCRGKLLLKLEESGSSSLYSVHYNIKVYDAIVNDMVVGIANQFQAINSQFNKDFKIGIFITNHITVVGDLKK